MGPGSRLALVLILGAAPLAAQLSSNASLQGSYNFRYLGVIGNPCDCPISFQGAVTFDGKGAFQMTGQGTYNNGSDHVINGPGSGHYQVFSSGTFQMDNPFANGGVTLFGGAGVGAVVASSSESGYLDLFVAIPAGSGLNNGVLTGSYQAAALEFAGGGLGATRNALFSMAADGAGGLGNVAVQGTSQVLKNVPATQTILGATYTVSANGSGTLNLPAPAGVPAANQLVAGTKTLYAAADGSFFIAGTGSGYDLILGVRSGSQVIGRALQGQYFTGLLENLADGSPTAGVYSSWGAVNELADASGSELAHQRINVDGVGRYDQTFSDSFLLTPGGTVSYPSSQYVLGFGGNFVIGSGNGANYQLSLYVKTPAISGSGVFVNPQGVVNAANNAPFTAQVSPGEVISLYGSGLASQTATAGLPFPASLAGVQVTVNGTPAPVYYVSPSQISAVVPYSIPLNAAVSIQVSNNGSLSNAVTEYSGQTSPGVFTVPAGGLGSGAILHADFSLVSAANPARAGETVQIYLTGLGAVQPPLNAGTVAPLNPLTVTANDVAVYINKQPARIAFQGLAPTLAGLYQVNLVIPSGIAPGNADLEIVTVDADNVQAVIPIR